MKFVDISNILFSQRQKCLLVSTPLPFLITPAPVTNLTISIFLLVFLRHFFLNPILIYFLYIHNNSRMSELSQCTILRPFNHSTIYTLTVISTTNSNIHFLHPDVTHPPHKYLFPPPHLCFCNSFTLCIIMTAGVNSMTMSLTPKIRVRRVLLRIDPLHYFCPEPFSGRSLTGT